MLIYFNQQKCPSCGHHSMSVDREPVEITTFRFVIQHLYVRCRNCNITLKTDMAFASNIIIKSMLVKADCEDT